MDTLKLEIMRVLEIDWEWRGRYDPEDLDGIARARSEGRKAGRTLGMKVRTFQRQIDPVTVLVLVTINGRPSDPDEQARMEERTRLIIQALPDPDPANEH